MHRNINGRGMGLCPCATTIDACTQGSLSVAHRRLNHSLMPSYALAGWTNRQRKEKEFQQRSEELWNSGADVKLCFAGDPSRACVCVCRLWWRHACCFCK
mmetsp:Transcript_297/g.542  ORF Transcript_297/g.542 Transcript_297/m.542 type:complete len:100 (-) Transcript_297:1183-1482(-)